MADKLSWDLTDTMFRTYVTHDQRHCIALHIAMVHEREVSLAAMVPVGNDLYRYSYSRPNIGFGVAVNDIPESSVLILNEELRMSLEWTVFMIKLGSLSEAEINALAYIVEWSAFLVDNAALEPVHLTDHLLRGAIHKRGNCSWYGVQYLRLTVRILLLARSMSFRRQNIFV